MGKKIKRSRVRSKGKESAKAFVESVDQKMNVLDKWLFGEDVKERSEKAKLQQRQQGRGEDGGAGGEEQEGQEGAGVVEEDDDPPVLFTLNMSDLRALISFIYGYHDLIETINLEYADESFGLVSEVRTRIHLSIPTITHFSHPQPHSSSRRTKSGPTLLSLSTLTSRARTAPVDRCKPLPRSASTVSLNLASTPSTRSRTACTSPTPLATSGRCLTRTRT